MCPEAVGLNAKRPNGSTRQALPLISTPQEQTEMATQTNLINQRANYGISSSKSQDVLAPLVDLIDKSQFAQSLGQTDGFEILAVRLDAPGSTPALSGEEFVDHDFFGELCERAGMIRDCPASGFYLQRLHVCDRRNVSTGHPTANSVDGFDRFRMAGFDGVPRVGDRDAGTVIYSRSADSFMYVKRDGLAPRRISFFDLCKLLAEHRKALSEVSV